LGDKRLRADTLTMMAQMQAIQAAVWLYRSN